MPLLTQKEFAARVESEEKVNYANLDGLDIGKCYVQLSEFDSKPQDYQRVLSNLNFCLDREFVGAKTALALLQQLKVEFDKKQGSKPGLFSGSLKDNASPAAAAYSNPEKDSVNSGPKL